MSMFVSIFVDFVSEKERRRKIERVRIGEGERGAMIERETEREGGRKNE